MKLHNFLRAAQLLGRFGFLFKAHHWLLQNGLQCKMRLMSASRSKDLSKTSSAQSRSNFKRSSISSAFRMVEEPHPTMTSLSISHTTRKQKSYLYPSFRRLLKTNLWASTIVCRQRLFRLNLGSYIDMRASPPGSRSWSICRYKVLAYTARCKEHCQDNFKNKVYIPHSMHI